MRTFGSFFFSNPHSNDTGRKTADCIETPLESWL
mgnify:CR=1 FL=1